MKIMTFALTFIFLIQSVYPLSEESQELKQTLQSLEQEMISLKNEGFHVIKYNDTLTTAKQLYETNSLLEESDYSLVYQKINEIEELKQKAFKASDELIALELAINQTEGINLDPVWEVYYQAKDEFNSERYEQCLLLIDKTYEKISETEALDTKVKAFYEATSRNIISFLKQNWKVILIIFVVISLAVLLTHNRIATFLIKNRIKNLKERKSSVKNLIKKTQEEYFDKGVLNESDYHIKLKKYGELIRDLNRQIPLLEEELILRSKRKI